MFRLREQGAVCSYNTPPLLRRVHSTGLSMVPFVLSVTWMARALLGNGPVNTPQPNTRKATVEDVSRGVILLLIARQQRANEDAGLFMCGLPYATVGLSFLCVVRAEPT
jgi:hypothetical protein